MTCLTTFAKFVFSPQDLFTIFSFHVVESDKKRFIICNSRIILFKNQTNMFLFITESRWFTYTRWFAEISYTVYIHIYIYYWVVMAVIGQGTSLSVRQSFKVKPVHYAHRTRTANPVIPSKKSIRGLCCNLFRTINSPWASLMWR